MGEGVAAEVEQRDAVVADGGGQFGQCAAVLVAAAVAHLQTVQQHAQLHAGRGVDGQAVEARQVGIALIGDAGVAVDDGARLQLLAEVAGAAAVSLGHGGPCRAAVPDVEAVGGEVGRRGERLQAAV